MTRSLDGALSKLKEPILLSSFRRSGTHASLDHIRLNVGGVSDQIVVLETLDSSHREHSEAIDRWRSAARLKGRVLIKSHRAFDDPAAAGLEKIAMTRFQRQSQNLLVVRDPRDVMVSFYHYVRSFSAKTKDLSLQDFVEAEDYKRIKDWAHFYRSWIDAATYHLIRYEELLNEPEKTLNLVAKYLGSELRSPVQIVEMRSRASSAVAPRKGVVGGWREELTPQVAQRICDEAETVMTRFGYVA